MRAVAIRAPFSRWTWLLLAIVVGLSLFCVSYYWLKWHRRVAALNGLRDEINAHYGYKDGTPCINWGPCGRFAQAFREEWNARFRDQVNIVSELRPPSDRGGDQEAPGPFGARS